MSGVKTSKVAKDANASPQSFSYGFFDESGTGTGPFDPTIVLLDSGANVIDPATKEQLPASLGQKTSAQSLSVTVASDQTPVQVAVTGTLPAFENPAEVNITDAGPAALEAGGNLEATATNTDAAATALGAPADAEATNTSSAWSVTALLKGIFTKLGGVVLGAGSAIVGQVGIDQTLDGVSNGVVIKSSSPLPPGQNIYGAPITRAATLTVKPQVTVGTYGAGTVVGGLLTFNNAIDLGSNQFSGCVKSIRLLITATCKATFNLYLFNIQPAASIWTDGQQPSLAGSDAQGLLGCYPLNNADSALGMAYTFYQLDDVNIHYSIPNSNDILYGVLVINGTTVPTFSTSNDVSLSLGIIKY
jgi:hypothetical protein